MGLLWWISSKESACNAENHLPSRRSSLGWEDPLEKEMAIYSSVLIWEIPWTEEPSGLQPMGLQEFDVT